MMPPKIPASPPCRVINFSLENRFRLITSRAVAFDGRKIRLIHQSRARYSYSLSHHLKGFFSTIPGGDRRISEPSTVPPRKKCRKYHATQFVGFASSFDSSLAKKLHNRLGCTETSNSSMFFSERLSLLVQNLEYCCKNLYIVAIVNCGLSQQNTVHKMSRFGCFQCFPW